MKTTLPPNVRPLGVRRVSRHERGMILIMVIVVLVLLAVMATAALQIARVDRMANHRFTTDNIDTVAAATIAQIQKTLVDDLFDANGKLFNHQQPNPADPSDPNKGGARSPYDYPWTNNSVTGNFLWPNATGGYFDDTWLSATAPDFTTPANPVWSHLTNLNGVFLDLPAAGGVDIQERVVDNASPDTSDTNISVLGILDQAVNASYLPRGADADSDGAVDSRWTYAPIRTISGISYYIAVRIVDNSSLANANVWTSSINSSGNYDTTNAGDHAPRGFYPSELNLGRFVHQTYSTPASSPAIAPMTEAQKLLRYRATGNPSDALQVLPGYWWNPTLTPPAPEDPITNREPWSRPTVFTTTSYLLNPRTRGNMYLNGAALWNGTSPTWGAAGAFVFSYRNLPMSDEMDLRYKNGLVDPTVATTLGSLTNGMHHYMRKDQPLEGLYTDFTQKVSGGSAAPNAANLKLFFEENPRTQITVRSGASVYAPRLPDYTGVAVITHNGTSLPTTGTALLNDPLMPIKLDLNPLSYATQANRLTFENAPRWSPAPDNIQTIYAASDSKAMGFLSREVRRIIERGDFRLPWRTTSASTASERQLFANSFALNIRNFYHDINLRSTVNRPMVTATLGAAALGWRPFPVITEVYLQKAYNIDTASFPPVDNGNGTWQVQWTPQRYTTTRIAPPNDRWENGVVIEIRNPYSYNIDLRGVLIAVRSIAPAPPRLGYGPTVTDDFDLSAFCNPAHPQLWSTWGSRSGSPAATIMRPNDVIYLYHNAGTALTPTPNNDMLARLPATNPPTNNIHRWNLNTAATPPAMPLQTKFHRFVQAFQPMPRTTKYYPSEPVRNNDAGHVVEVSIQAQDFNLTTAGSTKRVAQTVLTQTFNDIPTELSSAYTSSIPLTPDYTGIPTTELRLNPPQDGRLREPNFFDPAHPAGVTPTAGIERYKIWTVIGNGNGLNALTVSSVGNIQYVTRTNSQSVAQAASPTAYVSGIPMIPQGSLGLLLVKAKGADQPEQLMGSIVAEKQQGEDNAGSVPGGWGTPGGVGEDWVVSVGEIDPAVAKGSLNTPAGGWGAWPLGYIPAGFYGPGNPPASIYPDPLTDIPANPPAPILPMPPAYVAPVPPADIPPIPFDDIYGPNPPADIPAVPAIGEGAFVQALEPPFPMELNIPSFATKDKTTAIQTYSAGMFAPYLAKLPATMPLGRGGNASSLLATQQLVCAPPLNSSQFNRLGTVGQISMVAAMPWYGTSGNTLLSDMWSSMSPPATDINQFMLDFRSPRFVGGSTHDGNLAVPHATFLIDRLTTVSPLKDGLDNDGDGVVDPGDEEPVFGIDGRLNDNATAAELFVPGLLNINTVPRHILLRSLPIPTTSGNTVVLDSVVNTLINYRDMKSNFSAQDRGVAPGFRTKGGAGFKGIAYVGEIFAALNMMPAGDPGDIGNNFDGGGLPIDDVDINGTVIDWWGQDVTNRKGVKDGIANDRKEKMMIPAMLSGMLSTRSDIYTAYILVQGFPTGDFSTGPMESARLYVVLDRSACTPQNRAARIIGIYKY